MSAISKRISPREDEPSFDERRLTCATRGDQLQRVRMPAIRPGGIEQPELGLAVDELGRADGEPRKMHWRGAAWDTR